MDRITYRVHQSGWSKGQALELGIDWLPPVEHVVKGRLGKANAIGWVPIFVAGRVVARPHWTDIKGYFSERGDRYF